jgi:predicted CopG family antitoxin
MANNILLNKKVFSLTFSDLPCLITYCEKAGGSQFSVSLIADLFLRGSKILFISAYPRAKDEFFKQTKISEKRIIYVENEKDIAKSQNYQAIILKSGDADLLLKTIRILDDVNERIVFIKNMEIFSYDVIKYLLELKNVILSGDLDKCEFKEQINRNFYKTVIVFSKPKEFLPINIPGLEKYSGFLWSSTKEGIVSLDTER